MVKPCSLAKTKLPLLAGGKPNAACASSREEVDTVLILLVGGLVGAQDVE